MKKSAIGLAVACLCLAPFGAGLAQAPAAQPVSDPAKSAAAIVNKRTITLAEVEEQIKRQPILGYQMKAAGSDAAKIAQVRLTAANGIIERELLLEAAKKSQAVSDDEIKKGVNDFIAANYGSEEKLTPLLKGIGTSLAQFKSELADDIRIRGYLTKMMPAKITATDEELKKLYDANPARYAPKETVHARHILLKMPASATDEQKKDAKKKIDALYADAIKPGADFAKLAQENSQDGSAQRGGDLGDFGRGMMVPEFETAAFALKPGEISKPVQTQFGYHLIKVEAHQEASAPDFTKAKPVLEREYEMRKRTEIIQAKIAELRKAAKIEIKLPADKP